MNSYYYIRRDAMTPRYDFKTCAIIHCPYPPNPHNYVRLEPRRDPEVLEASLHAPGSRHGNVCDPHLASINQGVAYHISGFRTARIDN